MKTLITIIGLMLATSAGANSLFESIDGQRNRSRGSYNQGGSGLFDSIDQRSGYRGSDRGYSTSRGITIRDPETAALERRAEIAEIRVQNALRKKEAKARLAEAEALLQELEPQRVVTVRRPIPQGRPAPVIVRERRGGLVGGLLDIVDATVDVAITTVGRAAPVLIDEVARHGSHAAAEHMFGDGHGVKRVVHVVNHPTHPARRCNSGCRH